MCVFFCGPGYIETELHFLFECSEYARMDEKQQLLLHCEQLRPSNYFSIRHFYNDLNTPYSSLSTSKICS